jgi:hypothetical protein
MHPSDLKPSQFNSYPPQARQLAVANLTLFRKLPEIMLSIVLQEVIEYDWKFPAERDELEGQLAYLTSLTPVALDQLVAGFAKLKLSPALETDNWVKSPREHVERLTADLWATHQMESFRAVADQYQASVDSAVPRKPQAIPRLGMVVIGQGVREYNEPLFQRLRPHGVYFENVRPENGVEQMLGRLVRRAVAHPTPYAHWYVDGGKGIEVSEREVTSISYDALAPSRNVLLGKMETIIRSGGGGPEGLRTALAQITPEQLGLSDLPADATLNRFQVTLLTEGSGTQIFSTTFAQWAGREILRRAQPSTLLIRFAPRQRQQEINELLSPGRATAETDPVGSLIDADMGAYYTWLNQQRLSGAEQSSFIVWFEGNSRALAIGPSIPRGTQSSSSTDLNGLLELVT